MRRTVFVETRSAAAASATVIKGPRDDGPLQTVLASSAEATALASAEADGPSDNGAASLSSTESKDSEAQEGTVPGAFDGDWVLVPRHDVGGRSPNGNFGMDLPMPPYYSAK
jgi:hypothetical protein